jgi:TatD DNase family protein
MPFRGKRNEPSYILYVANKIAEIHQIPLCEIERITSENAIKLFNIEQTA